MKNAEVRSSGSDCLMTTSPAIFDLMIKAIHQYACRELRIEKGILVLQVEASSIAYVDVTGLMPGAEELSICLTLPKTWLDVLRAAKTNSNVKVNDIGERYAEIQLGNLRTVLEKKASDISPRLLSALSYTVLTEAYDLQLERNLFVSLCRSYSSSFYAHAQGDKIVSVGTRVDSLDFQEDHLDWVEHRDIVINCDVVLRCNSRNIDLRIVRVAGKHHLLIEYTLTDNFIVKHFVKAN